MTIIQKSRLGSQELRPFHPKLGEPGRFALEFKGRELIRFVGDKSGVP